MRSIVPPMAMSITLIAPSGRSAEVEVEGSTLTVAGVAVATLGVVVGVLGVAVGAGVGAKVGAAVGAAVAAGGAAQVEPVIVFACIVTAPFRARARPMMVAPVLRVISVRARIVPWKLVEVPSVAELPICQKTLQARAPLMRFTELLDAVVRVEPAWKMNTASWLPPPSRVSAPFSWIEEPEL